MMSRRETTAPSCHKILDGTLPRWMFDLWMKKQALVFFVDELISTRDRSVAFKNLPGSTLTDPHNPRTDYYCSAITFLPARPLLTAHELGHQLGILTDLCKGGESECPDMPPTTVEPCFAPNNLMCGAASVCNPLGESLSPGQVTTLRRNARIRFEGK